MIKGKVVVTAHQVSNGTGGRKSFMLCTSSSGLVSADFSCFPQNAPWSSKELTNLGVLCESLSHMKDVGDVELADLISQYMEWAKLFHFIAPWPGDLDIFEVQATRVNWLQVLAKYCAQNDRAAPSSGQANTATFFYRRGWNDAKQGLSLRYHCQSYLEGYRAWMPGKKLRSKKARSS